MYGSLQLQRPQLRYEMDEQSVTAQAAARLVQDELLLDCSPALNLAGFATTYMEPEIESLMLKSLVSRYISPSMFSSSHLTYICSPRI